MTCVACREKATEGEVSSSHIRHEALGAGGEEVQMSLGHREKGLQDGRDKFHCCCPPFLALVMIITQLVLPSQAHDRSQGAHDKTLNRRLRG